MTRQNAGPNVAGQGACRASFTARRPVMASLVPAGEPGTGAADGAGRAVGFAVTGPSQDADADERTGELYAIYLDPDRFGRGIGKRLLEHAIGDLRGRGVRTATLWG